MRRQLLPAELETMHPRQRDLMRVIYSSGGATLREVHAQIPMLRRRFAESGHCSAAWCERGCFASGRAATTASLSTFPPGAMSLSIWGRSIDW